MGDLVDRIDALFEQAITTPDAVDDQSLGDWVSLVSDTSDRQTTRTVRRAVNTARKLAKYWSGRDPGSLPHWRNGVDEALGGRGWQCQLDAATHALSEHPSAESYAEVKRWHRAVHFTEWMEGVEFEEWLEVRDP